VLADWWYWTNRIAQHQQRFAAVNGSKKSKQLSNLIGELTCILTSNQHGRRGNAMVHNYWSDKHVADRLRWTAEEYGIKVNTISEAHTSRTCPRCRSRHPQRVLRGFRCLDCGLEAHRDAVGVFNMAARCGGYDVRRMVCPMLLRWDGCGRNRSDGMPTQEKRSRVEA